MRMLSDWISFDIPASPLPGTRCTGSIRAVAVPGVIGGDGLPLEKFLRTPAAELVRG